MLELSSLLMKTMCGISWASRNWNSGASVSARWTSGSQTTTATSATISAHCVSFQNSTDPGQSRKCQVSPRNSPVAAEISTLMLRLRASGEASPTVLPSFWLPRRSIAPQVCRSDSSKVVLPLKYGPTSAATRGAAGVVPGISTSFPGIPSLPCGRAEPAGAAVP